MALQLVKISQDIKVPQVLSNILYQGTYFVTSRAVDNILQKFMLVFWGLNQLDLSIPFLIYFIYI